MHIDTQFVGWFDALYTRHTANLQFSEVRRALQALSQCYVQRRDKLGQGTALDGAGKRAAFGLFYAPLHFLTVKNIVAALAPAPAKRIIDLGCGTGAGAAAWSLEQMPCARVEGVDLNAWAINEARWNWRHFGLRGAAMRGDATRFRFAHCGKNDALLAAYTVNELTDAARDALLLDLLAAQTHGASVLIVEPISKRIAPWWQTWSTAFEAQGGRSDTWRHPANLPEKLKLLDRASGMDHRELTARSIYMPGA